MKTYSNPLWGYKLAYPDDWVEQKSGQIEAFAAIQEAFDQNYAGAKAGYLLVRGEFNHTAESIDPLWNSHIAKISMMVGAKDLGSAPLSIEAGAGYEAEIVLPKTRNKRLWTGILSYGLTILHLMVEHPLDQRDWFEPLATKIISSLRFIQHIQNLETTGTNIPLPPDSEPIDPKKLLSSIDNSQKWDSFSSKASVDSLQAFYLRELPRYGWEISGFTPYPSQTDLNFARLHLSRGGEKTVLGILPNPAEEISCGIVIKY